MAEKMNFMVFRALFLYEVHIQQRWYLTGEKKTEYFKIIKKYIMASQKCKNIWLQAALKHFWSSANPKLKKNQVCQNSYFFMAIMKEIKE